MAAQKSTILLCDDDRLVLATLSDGLARSGYTVIECDNGDDAILLARQHRPDLALLDLRMQGKSGMDVAGYLRDIVGTPFMFLSAFSDASTVNQAIELGALGYLVKPLELNQIVPELELALDRARNDRSSALLIGSRVASQYKRLLPDPEARPVAIGILMARYGVSIDQATRRLAAWADRIKVSEIDAAQMIVFQTDSLSENETG